MTTMTTSRVPLSWLPSLWITALEHCGSETQWVDHFTPLDWDARALCEFCDGQIYHVPADELGVAFVVRAVSEKEASLPQLWGLTGLIIDPARFKGDWQASFDGARISLQQAIEVFGEPLGRSERNAIFELRSPHAQEWQLLLQFGPGGQDLEELTILRPGPWLPWPETFAERAPTRQEQPIPDPFAVEDLTVPITCASHGTVPRTGLYEGLLPPNHPDFRYFSQIPGRFAFRQKGERMVSLGLVPGSDEALVVWTWLREQ